MLGLGQSLKKTGLITPGVVTDNLVMKHMYPAGAVQPLSDGALYTDGSATYVDLGNEFVSTIADSHSICFWIKFDDTRTGGTDMIIGAENSGPQDKFYIGITSGGQIKWYLKGNNGTAESMVSNALDDGPTEWMHVAFTAELGASTGETGNVYINGALDNTESLSTLTKTDWNAYDSDKNLYLGAWNSNGSVGSYIKAYMCNFGIWGGVLTQAEIKSIMWKQYADLTTSEKTSLVSWWNLDSTIDSTATLGNTVVYDNHNATLGDNIVDNPTFDGGVELPWTDRNLTGDEYVEPSTEQVYTGSHSLKIYAENNDSGTNGHLTETTVAGKLYRFEAWVYVVSGQAEINPSDGAFGSYDPAGDEEVRSTTTGQWEELVTYAWCDSPVGPGTATFFIQSNAGAALFYVDNVKVQIVQGNPGELK